MKTILMNMVMIYDRYNKKVLVLDKKKKHGWEGLTFPGGHVEKIESFNDSAIREIKEETNLNIFNLKLKGFIQWYVKDNVDERHVGILYYTEDFTGNLIEDNIEGKLFWMDLDEFINMPNKSDSMDDCMKIYLDEFTEIVNYFEKDKKLDIKYFE